LRLGALALQHVERGRHFEMITVRIPFEAEIHRLRLDTGERIANSELPRREFEECWSFVRRRGARTRTAERLIEGKFPNCVAALEMNQSAHCGRCQCLVRNGEFDWVLAEITQACEWGAQDELGVAGLAAYAERAKTRRTLVADRAVGSVRTMGLLAGETSDRTVVEVVWTGRLVTLEPGASDAGQRPSPPGERRSLFVFARRAMGTPRPGS